MIKVFCNRCGVEIVPDFNKPMGDHYYILKYETVNPFKDDFEEETNSIDLCDICTGELTKFLEGE